MVALAKITKAELAAQARATYIAYEIEHLSISSDDRGAFAVVQSQSQDIVYKVYFVEPKDGPSYAVSCECPDHMFRRRPCYHMTEIVNQYHQHIHQTIRRPGRHEMDLLVAQLEREFGLVEEVAPVVPAACPVVAPKAKKPRRSAVNVELVESLKVAQGVKVRMRKGALVVKCPKVAPEVSPKCPVIVPQKAVA